MDTRSLLEPLLHLPPFGTGPGLQRLATLCEPILRSAWFRNCSVIHVVGTDGKGSVSAMLSALLGGLGIRCGRYTSPHLLRFHERIVVDDEAIEDNALSAAIHWFHDQSRLYERRHFGETIGAFEAFTAIALYHFSQRQPRVLVMEAGIGGRQDCTRILAGDMALLTSVSLEHTRLLGDSVEEIAADKMDILEPGGTLVVGELPEGLQDYVVALGAQRDLRVFRTIERVRWHNIHQSRNGMVLQGQLGKIPLEDLHCPLTGPHQAGNLALALAGAAHWLGRHCLYLTPGQLAQTAQHVLPTLHWPGRFQRIKSSPPVYVDVAHTRQAMTMLATTLRQTALAPPILVLGLSHDRDPAAVLTPLLPEGHAVILTQSRHRGIPVAELAAALDQPAESTEASVARAVDRALELARPQNRPVLITGSTFVAAEATGHLQGLDPQQLLLF